MKDIVSFICYCVVGPTLLLIGSIMAMVLILPMRAAPQEAFNKLVPDVKATKIIARRLHT